MSDDHSPAVHFLAAHSEARATNRARWKENAGDLLLAHEAALSAVVSLIERFSRVQFKPQRRAMEGRMALTAQFVQGVELCETAISEALYSQAANLLKQEMETIEAIHQFEQGNRIDGKTPFIGGRLAGFGRIYGELNDLAHVSQHDLARALVTIKEGDVCAPTLVPQYRVDLSKLLYGWLVYFIVQNAQQVASMFEEIFGEGTNDHEENWLALALSILLKEGAIQLPEGADLGGVAPK